VEDTRKREVPGTIEGIHSRIRHLGREGKPREAIEEYEKEYQRDIEE